LECPSLQFLFLLFFFPEPLLVIPDWVSIINIVIIGFLFGVPYPVFFELGVELTYPVQESYSAGLITFLTNLVALIVLIAGSYIPTNVVNASVTISFIVCIVAMIFVKEEYKRLKVDTLSVV